MKWCSMNWNERGFCWIIEINRQIPVAFVTAELGGALCGPTPTRSPDLYSELLLNLCPSQRASTVVAVVRPRILQFVHLTITFLPKPGSHKSGRWQFMLWGRLASVTTKSSVPQRKKLIIYWTKWIALCYKDWSVIFIDFSTCLPCYSNYFPSFFNFVWKESIVVWLCKRRYSRIKSQKSTDEQSYIGHYFNLHHHFFFFEINFLMLFSCTIWLQYFHSFSFCYPVPFFSALCFHFL